METSGDEVADLVLREFELWPAKRKPVLRNDGVREWVPLSGIVAQGKAGLTCLAAATGMKCLPQNKICLAQGVVLHDWHAEILAVRSFNRFLLDECQALLERRIPSSEIIRFRGENEKTDIHFQPFAIRDEISLHMYCSEAPCGDASMELTIAAQQDSTPWATPPSTTSSITTPNLLRGRGYFSHLGAVRGKPSRPDAPPTLSKSCSDKLTLKQITSLLSSLTSLLISPQNCYLKTIVLPSSQYSETACTRAFSVSGRIFEINERIKSEDWEAGYSFAAFNIVTTEKEFVYSRRQDLKPREKLIASNISSAWTPNRSETLIGGTLQGRKQFSVSGASMVSQMSMWKLALEIIVALQENYMTSRLSGIESCLRVKNYHEVKESEVLEQRRKAKEIIRGVLGGWIRNCAGGEWDLNNR